MVKVTIVQCQIRQKACFVIVAVALNEVALVFGVVYQATVFIRSPE